MSMFKFVVFLCLGLFVLVQSFLLVPEFSGKKKITVYKRNYMDSNSYIRGYKSESAHIDVFNVKVNPKGFWDRLLLTNEEDGNLLVGFAKILFCLVFAFYMYNLEYENIFSTQSFNIFTATLFCCMLVYMVYYFGELHTRDFWRDFYQAHTGDDSNRFDFQLGLQDHSTFKNQLYLYVVPSILLQLYKTFRNNHIGKPDEGF
ncbi:MAG: hypothetical protein M3O71_00405 [Bacteroidota bacterium]|nr:hypothetical protein [Bacteroidota bacterium]